MASAVKICRVCGKEYEACHSLSKNTNTFRWQEVACSAECGATYLDKVNKSRGISVATKKTKQKKPAPIVEYIPEVECVEKSIFVETTECVDELPTESE